MTPYFITGIGTNVGKTFVSAILAEALQADYWKPVQTGNTDDVDKNTIQQLISNTSSICFKESYSFKEPVSPHLAAHLENSEINTDTIKLPPTKNKHLIIEGAGGLLVPLNDKRFVIDLAKQFDAEVILVCRNYLGCINHSLLSIDYLLKNNFRLKGLILNGTFNELVKSSIVNFAKVPVLGQFPETDNVNKASILQLTKNIQTHMFTNSYA
jgi:dethiobiotin synthetase